MKKQLLLLLLGVVQVTTLCAQSTADARGEGFGGGIYNGGTNSSITILNTLVTGNSHGTHDNSTGKDIYRNDGSVHAVYSVYEEAAAGTGSALTKDIRNTHASATDVFLNPTTSIEIKTNGIAATAGTLTGSVTDNTSKITTWYFRMDSTYATSNDRGGWYYLDANNGYKPALKEAFSETASNYGLTGDLVSIITTGINTDINGLPNRVTTHDKYVAGAWVAPKSSTGPIQDQITAVIKSTPNVTIDPAPGTYTMSSDTCLSLTITLEDNTEEVEVCLVINNDTIRNINADPAFTTFVYDIYPTEDVIIELLLLKTEPPVGNESIAIDQHVWTEGGHLVFQTDRTSDLLIYKISGQPLLHCKIESGITWIPQPQGVYIVVLNGKTYKLIVGSK